MILPSPHSAPCSSASLSMMRSNASRTRGSLNGSNSWLRFDEVPVQREPRLHLEFRIGLDLLHPVGRNVVDHVHFAGAQAGQPNGGLGHLAGDHAIEIGRAVPIIVEALQFDLMAEFVPHELERTRSDWRLALLVARARAE